MLLTHDDFKNLNLSYLHGQTGDWGASRMYGDRRFGIRRETHTERETKGDIYGGWKEPKVAYWVWWDDRVFDTADELYYAVFMTPWFECAKEQPVRYGYYETDLGRCYWNDKYWHTNQYKQPTKWRGLIDVTFEGEEKWV